MMASAACGANTPSGSMPENERRLAIPERHHTTPTPYHRPSAPAGAGSFSPAPVSSVFEHQPSPERFLYEYPLG